MNERIDRAKNGTVQMRAELDNMGHFHGRACWFYPASALQTPLVLQEAFYLHGELHGPLVRFSPEGRIIEKVRYHYGRKEGKQLRLYPQGSPKSEISFSGGTIHGECTFYYQGGQLKRRVEYLNGNRHGVDSAWSKEGVLLFCEEWREGVKVRDIAQDSIYLFVNKIYP